MFTGIIEHVGSVRRLQVAATAAAGARRLALDLGPLVNGLAPGASVAVNGACLTLAESQGSVGSFDVIPETWQRTNLSRLRVGDPVNLERSLRLGDRLDGHFVQGHVDGTAVVERVDRAGGDWKLWMTMPPELMPFLVPKGSIALDGASLTLVDVTERACSVALVPTTLARTTLSKLAPGDIVNVETDLLARLVVARLAALSGEAAMPTATAATGLTWERLRESGFAP